MRSPEEAPDTRTRILDAAIERFGREGFDASLRAIAADVGVSAPAIMKHFGSKERLHRACDERVLGIVGQYKTEAMRSADLRGTFVAQMAMLEEFQPLLRYLMRSMLTGGEAARRILKDMHTHALQWMQDGVEAGHIKPSRDEAARVTFTFSVSIGWMVQAALLAEQDLGDLDAEFWKQTMADMMLPTLEVYSEGLLTDGAFLEEYLLYVGDPPSAESADDDSAVA